MNIKVNPVSELKKLLCADKYIWQGKIRTTMMIDELLPMNLAVVLSLVNKIFQPQIND